MSKTNVLSFPTFVIKYVILTVYYGTDSGREISLSVLDMLLGRKIITISCMTIRV